MECLILLLLLFVLQFQLDLSELLLIEQVGLLLHLLDVELLLI